MKFFGFVFYTQTYLFLWLVLFLSSYIFPVFTLRLANVIW